MIKEENYKWENWAGNHSCIAANYFEPETADQIADIIGYAVSNRLKVRVVGSGHSFTPLALSNEVLVSLKHHGKLVSIENNFVTCQGGMLLHELYTILQENKLSLANFGVINKQTVAGAIATGTHGSGLTHKSLSSLIHTMKIMTSSGSIIEIDENTVIHTNNKEFNLLNAAAISLGLLGIVLEVTFKCEPLFFLQSEEHVISFDEYLDSMDDDARRYEYFKAWWFPHTDKVYVYKTGRIAEGFGGRGKYEQYTAEQRSLDLEIDKVTAPMFIDSNDDATLIPEINRHCVERFFTPRVRLGSSFEILVHDETVPMIVSEYGLSMENDIHKKALRAFRDTLERSTIKAHFPVDLRYAGAERAWLSPSYNRDTFYIGMCVREYKKKEIPASMKLFFDVMRNYDARLNWGKLSDSTRGELKITYLMLDDFNGIRRFLDPHDIFQNDYLKSIL